MPATHTLRQELNCRLWRPLLSTAALGVIAVDMVSRQRGHAMGAARLGCALMLRFYGMKVDVRGLDRLEPLRERIYICNHRAHIDGLAMVAACPGGVRFAAAKGLWHYTCFLGRALDVLGAVRIDRSDPKLAREALHADGSQPREAGLVIAPEGTISTSGTLAPFKSGAFFLAIDLQYPIVPVAIHNTSSLMPPIAFGSYEYRSINPGKIVVEFLEPIPTAGLGSEDRHALKEKVRSALVQALRPVDGGAATRADLGLPAIG